MQYPRTKIAFEALEERKLLAMDFSQVLSDYQESRTQYKSELFANTLASGEGPSNRVVSIEPATVDESAGFVAATLTLDKPAFGNELVWVSVIDNTAILGSDYMAYIQPVAFSTGQTAATVRFDILDDNIPENAEAFFGYLIQPSNVAIGTGTAKITINDDDGAFQPRVVSIHPTIVNESAGTVDVLITLDQAAFGSESVRVSVIDGTAVLGLDYMSHIQTATFVRGQTSSTIRFSILNDDRPENVEEFYGYLLQPNNLTIGTSTAKITINDDDGEFQPRLVTVHPTTVNEFARTVDVRLTLDQVAIGGESVQVSVIDGTAVLGQDYVSHIQTVTFAAGQTAATVRIDIIDDNVRENKELFFVYLFAPNNLVIVDDRAAITIEDNQGPLLTYHSTANFRLPNRLFVNVGSYANLNQVFAAETRIDWRTQTTEAKTITLAFAAKELLDHLNAAGANISLNVIRNYQSEGNGIYLLTQEDDVILSELRSRGITIQFEKMQDQGFVIVDSGGSLFLVGKTRIGCLYAAYALLDELGFKWLTPTDSVIPNLPTVTVPLLPIIEEPQQRYRGFWTFGDTEDRSESDVVVDQQYLLWMARNRLNIAGSVATPYNHKLGIYNWGGGHHVIRDILGLPELFDQHPEWYGQLSGTRVPIRSTDSDFYVNPNFANEQMINYFSQVLIGRLVHGDMREIEIISLWPSDARSTYNWDGSADALAIGNRTDNLLNFYAGIAERLTIAFEQNQINRLVSIAGIAYFTTWDAPTNKSIVARLEHLRNFIQIFYLNERSYSGTINDPVHDSDRNREIVNRIASWHQSANLDYGVVEYLNYSIYSGVANTALQSFASDFAYYSENAGTFFAYTHANRNNIGPRKVTNKLIAQLSWKEYDPSRFQYKQKSAELKTDEYFAISYGDKAAEVKRVYMELAAATSNVAEIANSCNFTIFQDLVWTPPPLTTSESERLLNACVQGGRQSLRDLPFENVFLAEFVGVADSVARLTTLATTVSRLIDSTTISNAARERLSSEYEWFAITLQRFQLISLAIDYRLHTTVGSAERAAIVSKINVLVDSILANPITADTLSKVNQRSGVFALYRLLT